MQPNAREIASHRFAIEPARARQRHNLFQTIYATAISTFREFRVNIRETLDERE